MGLSNYGVINKVTQVCLSIIPIKVLMTLLTKSHDPPSTHKILSSSFLGLPYRVPNINHKKELLRSLWVDHTMQFHSFCDERFYKARSGHSPSAPHSLGACPRSLDQEASFMHANMHLD